MSFNADSFFMETNNILLKKLILKYDMLWKR